MPQIELTDVEKAALARTAPESCRHGHNEFRLCPMCGLSDWVTGNASKPHGVGAQIGSEVCYRCQEVHQRDPELTRWVLAVLAWQKRLDQKPPG